MTDPLTAPGVPERGLPAPTFFDPSFERLPGGAAFDAAHPGPVVLLYDPRADRDWAADAAIALATGWHAGGRRTVLADLSLEDPFLHDRIGVGNLDGVVDIFLYGASLARSARPVPGRGFYLITAGTYTPDPGVIFRHPRWEKLVAGFRDAQASLLLFVPADSPEVGAVRAWAREAILLGSRVGEAAFAPALAQGFLPRAWLTPPAGAASAAAPAPAAPPAPRAPERFPEPEPAPPVTPWTAAPRDAAALRPPEEVAVHDAPGAPASPFPVPDPAWEEELLPPSQGRRRGIPKERKVSPLMLVLLVILLMVLLGVVLLQFFPDVLTRIRPRAAETPPAVRTARAAPPARPAAPAEAAGTPRPYAVFVAAYPLYEPARRKAEEVAGRISDAPVYVIPEATQEVVYQKVYAGMLQDTVDAAALRQRLVDAGLVDTAAVGGPGALIQPRPLAFELGDFATADQARSRAAELASRAISAYAVPVPQSDGTERWTLYGGAFADSTSAASMRKILQGAGLPARLVQRTGRAPASPK